MSKYKRLTRGNKMKDYKRLTERTKHGIAVLDSGERFVLSCGGYATTKALNRLAELEDKIENGTLVELPCKVGNVVYEVFKNHKPPFGRATTIEKIIITNKGLRLKLSRNSVYETAISSLGKTLFLTEAEAIAKLEELKYDNA